MIKILDVFISPNNLGAQINGAILESEFTKGVSITISDDY